jgi:hypothetical protein
VRANRNCFLRNVRMQVGPDQGKGSSLPVLLYAWISPTLEVTVAVWFVHFGSFNLVPSLAERQSWAALEALSRID